MNKLDCKSLVEQHGEITKSLIDKSVSEGCRRPSLVVILVGNNPASQTYVRKKKESCESLGIIHRQINFSEDTPEQDVLHMIDDLNNDDTVDGILVQLPLPIGFDENKVINRISPSKDVDGFSPANVGKMMLGHKCFLPCTPSGILEILSYFNIPTEGKNVLVIGRSNIVGRPIANLLSQKPFNANVTICHSYTSEDDLKNFVSAADIIILSVGKAKFFGNRFFTCIKPNTTIIDVGINRIPDSTKKSGSRLCGDFDSEGFREFESAFELGNMSDCYEPLNISYTPVPGGVGLTTVMMLMSNTVEAWTEHTKEA